MKPEKKIEPTSMKGAVFGAVGKEPPNEDGTRPMPPPKPKGVRSRIDEAVSHLKKAQDLLGDDVDLSVEIESAESLDNATE